jgi:hypothetical protein
MVKEKKDRDVIKMKEMVNSIDSKRPLTKEGKMINVEFGLQKCE